MGGLDLIEPLCIEKRLIVEKKMYNDTVPFCQLGTICGVRPESQGWYIYEYIDIEVGSPPRFYHYPGHYLDQGRLV